MEGIKKVKQLLQDNEVNLTYGDEIQWNIEQK